MSLTVRLWSEEEFAAGRETWQTLLAGSDADPLFMSWDWQWTWWQHHGALLQATLQLLAVTDADGRLVALAPLYLRNTRVKRLLPVRRLECMGTAWREDDAAFTEYFDVIAARSLRTEVASAIAGWLTQCRDWDDWAISHVRNDALVRQVARQLGDSGVRLRKVEVMPSHVIDLTAGFKTWVERLSSDVRRRLQHQRGRLQNPECRLIAAGNVASYLTRLQHWRAERHQGAGAGPTVREFEQALVLRLAASGALRLSELTHRGETLSLMLNVRPGDTEYYLASAFAPNVERGLSPGYLHFGYVIEAACAEGVNRFDLLAGGGRNRDYKTDFRAEARPLRSAQLLRTPLLKLLHRLAGSR